MLINVDVGSPTGTVWSSSLPAYVGTTRPHNCFTQLTGSARARYICICMHGSMHSTHSWWWCDQHSTQRWWSSSKPPMPFREPIDLPAAISGDALALRGSRQLDRLFIFVNHRVHTNAVYIYRTAARPGSHAVQVPSVQVLMHASGHNS